MNNDDNEVRIEYEQERIASLQSALDDIESKLQDGQEVTYRDWHDYNDILRGL